MVTPVRTRSTRSRVACLTRSASSAVGDGNDQLDGVLDDAAGLEDQDVLGASANVDHENPGVAPLSRSRTRPKQARISLSVHPVVHAEPRQPGLPKCHGSVNRALPGGSFVQPDGVRYPVVVASRPSSSTPLTRLRSRLRP